MKGFFCVLCCVAAMVSCIPSALGAEPEEALRTLSDALPQETQRILAVAEPEEGGGLEEGLAAVFASGGQQARALVRQMVSRGTALFLIVLLCDGAQLLYFREKDSRLVQCVSLTGSLAIVLLSSGSISDMIGLGAETIHTMNDFSKTLLPLLSMACAAGGSISASAVREVATTFFADLLITCIDCLLIPLVYVYIGAITANAVLQEKSLEKIALWIKKGTIWALTVLLTVFTAYLTLSGVLSGTADAAALRVARFAISGAVPVVGGILSNAASTVLVGASVLKNSIGIFGTVSIFALCIAPFVQIGLQYLTYKVAAFLADVVDQTGLSALMNEIGSAFGLILGMTGACAVLLLLSVVISVATVVAL